MKTAIAPLFLVLSMLAACDTSSTGAEPEPLEGREETKNIRNTKHIGVPGEAIADRVDGALDGNDAHNERMKQAEEELNQ